jgi:hypothetical protein
MKLEPHSTAARQNLQARIGVSSKADFVALDQAFDEAWSHLQRTSNAVDQRIRNHGCEAACLCSAESLLIRDVL